MPAIPDIGVKQIARRLGVSPARLYRYIPVARMANTVFSDLLEPFLRTPAVARKVSPSGSANRSAIIGQGA
jgi:hypothetical protein